VKEGFALCMRAGRPRCIMVSHPRAYALYVVCWLHAPLRFDPPYSIDNVEVFVVTYDGYYLIFDGSLGVYGVSGLQPISFRISCALKMVVLLTPRI
jgi:hypothetical protein